MAGKKREIREDVRAVKCKNCAHWRQFEKECFAEPSGVGKCDYAGWMCKGEGFCHYGSVNGTEVW